ncbi:hypothetical protein Tco_1238707, partial [Tanacetum coccineum]
VERGTTLTLAPKSTRALSKQTLLINQGKVKLPGSFSFWGMDREASNVRLCPVDTAYWEDPIRRIGYESALMISKVLIDAPWLRMAASVEARISLIKLEFSSCLFADSLMNLLRVSSIDCLGSWYEGFALFL